MTSLEDAIRREIAWHEAEAQHYRYAEEDADAAMIAEHHAAAARRLRAIITKPLRAPLEGCHDE
jgi:hypothetical protein